MAKDLCGIIIKRLKIRKVFLYLGLWIFTFDAAMDQANMYGPCWKKRLSLEIENKEMSYEKYLMCNFGKILMALFALRE